MTDWNEFNVHEVMEAEENDNVNDKGKAPKGKRTRASKKRSWVWEHFEQFKNKDGKDKSKCVYCGREYFSSSKDHGTKNLIAHLYKCDGYLAKIDEGQTQIGIQYGDEKKLVAWRFDQKECRKALAHMIIVDELPFSFVEAKGYRHYSSVSQPLFKVPCRSTITKDCYQRFLDEKKNIRDLLKSNIDRICLTTDSWTSTQRVNYMSLTAHFVDNDWILKKKILNFCLLTSHRGVEIGKTIQKCLIDWDLENILTISVDNASSNDVAIDFLTKRLTNWNKCLLKGKWTHVRCVAHILNLVVQDGIRFVGQSVNNVRNAVRWIRQSSTRIDNFKKYVEIQKCDSTKHLVLDVPTRWNSTYIMLETAQVYEKAFDRFDVEDTHFAEDLKFLKCDVPSSRDWEKARKLCRFLKTFYDVTLKVSGTHYVTSYTAIDYITIIHELLKGALSCDPKDDDLFNIACAMKEKFDKYFGHVEKMNLLLYFASVLDPRNKKPYLDIIIDDHYGKEVENDKKEYVLNNMKELYNDYVRILASSSTFESCSSTSTLGKRSTPEDTMPNPTMRNKLREKMKTHVIDSVSEFEKYLNESVEDESPRFDILTWWKVSSIRFPIFSLMARDVFAIPVSTVASESVFSTSGRVLNAFRSSLTPMIVEGLICSQDWIRPSENPNVEENWETILQLDEELQNLDFGKI